MNALRIGLSIFLGCIGLVIVACSIYVAATYQPRNPVSVWAVGFEDNGLVPGLILLCTGIILMFLPRSGSRTDSVVR